MAIEPYLWLDELSERLTPDDTVVCDAGSSYYMCHQRLRLPEGARLITDLAQGAMGFALPAAIGAALAKKKGYVYVVTGDGSWMYSSHNAHTIKQLDIENLTVYVLLNCGYQTIRDSQVTWCEGREIGLQEEMELSRFHPFVHFLTCSEYKVRRPTVG